MTSILISDVKCHDCNGPVTVFGVPDKVWKGLGLKKEWLCMGCVARRIHSNATAEQLEKLIKNHRKRFNLGQFNKFCGQTNLNAPYIYLFELSAELAGVESMTVAEVMGDFELP
jgi:hypothetical protein